MSHGSPSAVHAANAVPLELRRPKLARIFDLLVLLFGGFEMRQLQATLGERSFLLKASQHVGYTNKVAPFCVLAPPGRVLALALVGAPCIDQTYGRRTLRTLEQGQVAREGHLLPSCASARTGRPPIQASFP